MRLVPVLILVLFLAPVAARGESWVHTRDNGGGYPMCFDTASVKTDSDGLTHYAVKMCNDSTPQFYAVDCTKNFKVELLVRIYDIGSETRYREITIDDLNSGFAVDALMACRK
jgi:hypothetical protein